MPTRDRTLDILGAASVLLAFGALFVGRVIMWPVAMAPGSFFERLRAEAWAWDVSHAVMTVGLVAMLAAAMALGRALRAPGWSQWLVDLGQALVMLAAALGIGQFALDYAMLAAAQQPSLAGADAGAEMAERLRHYPFIDIAFYQVANPAWIGLGLLGVAMLLRPRWWRIAGAIALAAVVVKMFESSMGPIGPRIALGIQFVGFSIAAWLIARGPSRAPIPAG